MAAAAEAASPGIRITRLETITIRRPWGPPERGETRDWLLLRIHASNGLAGISRGGSRRIIEEELAPLLVGRDPRRIALLWQEMYDKAWRFRGPGAGAMSSIGAVDIALWDLYGQTVGQPVWRLLGGYRDRVTVYADGIGYYEQTPEEMSDLVRRHADLGFRYVKFHLTSPDRQVALDKVRLSREKAGPDVQLMVDAWRMWDGAGAAAMARRWAPFRLYLIEEPVRRDAEHDYLRMAGEATDALLAGGEGEGTLAGVRRLITEGGLEVVQSDILIGGGYTGLMRIAALAQAYHVSIAPHGAQYPDLNCHLVAAVPNGLMIPACPSTEPYQTWSELYDPPFRIEKGEVVMTEKPGLGLAFDQAFIDRYQVTP
jgi:L-alanine-DL-glutamate epimerase-like enolase superfamily enzyme